MLHPDDESQTVRVQPPLAAHEIELLAGLAGVGEGPRRVWPGQPGSRSPWLPCADGCCLVAEARVGADPVAWPRFLVRELLDPRAKQPRERAERFGLLGGHDLEGRVLLGGASAAGLRHQRLLVAVGRRVRVIELDEELFPIEPVRPRQRRERGEVVPMRARAQRTER